MFNNILRIKLTLFAFIIALQAFMIDNICLSSIVKSDIGILMLAHGGPSTRIIKNKENKYDQLPLWNKTVIDAIRPLEKKYNVEIAFGMADPETIQVAIDRLEEKGAKKIVAVPLFISSYSSIIENTAILLGLRKGPKASLKKLTSTKNSVEFVMTSAIDSHPLIAEILLDRATELSKNPDDETVIIIGHGPNDPKQNEKWLKEMMVLASFVKGKGGFKDVKVTTLRDDAPKEIREKATMILRKMVIMAGIKGNVIVIPHLIAGGGIESGIPERLKGLNYAYNGKTLLPHENITRWIDVSITHALQE
ncbi:MAG: sirohydrochlorin chelatase [Candidatus Scalindua sp.]